MSVIDKIAEVKLIAAIERGEFDNLAGEGRPLVLDEDSQVPEELCTAYRLLKNSGFLPSGLVLRNEIRCAEKLLLQVAEESEKTKLLLKIGLLRSQL